MTKQIPKLPKPIWYREIIECISFFNCHQWIFLIAVDLLSKYFKKKIFVKSLKTSYSDFSDWKILYSPSESLFKINNLSECVVSQMCWSQRYKWNLHIQLHPQHCPLKPMILETKLMFLVLRNTLFFLLTRLRRLLIFLFSYVA